jgi:FMN-dependent NADH-azoreductase
VTDVFGFLGVTDISFVRAAGVNYGPEQRQQSLESALAEVATLKGVVKEKGGIVESAA